MQQIEKLPQSGGEQRLQKKILSPVSLLTSRANVPTLLSPLLSAGSAGLPCRVLGAASGTEPLDAVWTSRSSPEGGVACFR